jgi:transcriptional regulator with XRE-family HTH domain
MDVAGRFGENLARCRGRADLTQEELGLRAAMSGTEIDTLERGERLPRIDTLVRLAGALSVSPDELLRGIGWRPGATMPGRFEPTAEGPGKGSG